MHTSLRWIIAAFLLSLSGAAMAATQPNPAQVRRDKSSNLFNYGDTDVKPVPVERAAPAYPPELRAAGIKGDVVVEFIIGLKGEVVVAQIVSSADSRLEEPCLAAVKTWKFTPAQKRGKVVNCRVSQRLSFDLPPPPAPPGKAGS
jgi:TonB family protein